MLLAAAILAFFAWDTAHATLFRPTPGAQNVRITLTPDVRSGLTTGGAYKAGSVIPMALSFDLPQDTSCQVLVTFKPVAGSATITGQQPQSNNQGKNDSSLGVDGKQYRFSCSAFQVGTRVNLPFEFVSKAQPNRASAVDASVTVYGGKGLANSIGYASLVLATNGGQVLKIAGTEQINKTQLELLTKDKDTRLSQLFAQASDEAPLDPKKVPAALSVDVSDTPKDTSEKGAR